MKKDMIFFAQDNAQGLTSTSANHIANLAKEMVRETEASLQTLSFYSTSVELIGTDSTNVLTRGSSRDELAEVPQKLHAISKAHALIAWLREAIKAKERMIDEAQSMSRTDYMKLMGIEPPKNPEMAKALTDDEYYASLTLAERNRYYELEARAAVLGKAIHPNGALADARDDLNAHVRTPREVRGSGRDALIYSYEPTVEPAAVDEMYFHVQKRFRETQAALNAIKFECQRAVKASQVEAQTAYAEALDKYNTHYNQISAEMAAYIRRRTREIGDYRIAIPESLLDIYQHVSQLGKKSGKDGE